MEISYWQSRWKKGKIGWHLDSVYPPLRKLWPLLPINPNASVVVPLCGKSIDLLWLAEQGYRIKGIDAVPEALKNLREMAGKVFNTHTKFGNTIYRTGNFELWEADFLRLPARALTPVDVIYDKAAIIALPPEKRKTYAEKLLEFAGPRPHIFMQTFDYIQSEMAGPPF